MLMNKVRHGIILNWLKGESMLTYFKTFYLGGYGYLTDTWSIGVILFTMIAQRNPFRDKRPDGIGK